MKYHIEKNTVQETLVIPLYGRKMCSELYPNLYRDETALRLMEQIDYDFSLLSQKSKSLMQQFGFLEAAMRQNNLAWEVRDYLREHPNAAVVNLGCGLDDTGRSCDNGSCRIYKPRFSRRDRRARRAPACRRAGGKYRLRPERHHLVPPGRRVCVRRAGAICWAIRA